jgi:hypothetical protein
VSELLSDLERSVLQRLSNFHDECGEPAWTTLNELSLSYDVREMNASDEVLELSPGSLVDAIVKVLERLSGDGMIDKYEEISARDTPFRLTHHGSYMLSGFDLVDLDQEASKEEPFRHDSKAWTGLPKGGVLSAAESERFGKALFRMNVELENASASNAEIAQARACLIALSAFNDAPEPPADLMWQIIARASDLATLGSLFVQLMILFTGK